MITGVDRWMTHDTIPNEWLVMAACSKHCFLVDTKLVCFGFSHSFWSFYHGFFFFNFRTGFVFRPLWQVLEVRKWVRRRWKQYCCYHRVTSQWKSESSLHEDEPRVRPESPLNGGFWSMAGWVAIVCPRFLARVRLRAEVLQGDFHCVDAIRESFWAQGFGGALRGPFLIHTHSLLL